MEKKKLNILLKLKIYGKLLRFTVFTVDEWFSFFFFVFHKSIRRLFVGKKF